jgi:hypothetical protein
MADTKRRLNRHYAARRCWMAVTVGSHLGSQLGYPGPREPAGVQLFSHGRDANKRCRRPSRDRVAERPTRHAAGRGGARGGAWI